MGSGGAASGGLGGSAAPASNAQQENDMRQSLMQKGRADRAEADSGNASTSRQAQARARALRTQRARQSWNMVLANGRVSKARGAFASIRTARNLDASTSQRSTVESGEISPRIRNRLLQLRSSVSTSSTTSDG